MKPISCGLAMCKTIDGVFHVLLVHPGGPLWEDKDLGSWSFPKGLIENGDEPLATAKREFEEETGMALPDCNFVIVGCAETSHKIIYLWALHGDCDVADIKSNMFHMEWPRGSGKEQEFEEIDRGEFFPLSVARERITPGQLGLLNLISMDVLCDPVQFCKREK